MRNSLTLTVVLMLLLVNGWFISIQKTEFYYIDIMIVLASLIVMPLLRTRMLFLYVVTAILGYGAFLTAYAFYHFDHFNVQVDYIRSHLLVTSFLLLFWIVVHYVKTIHEENVRLKEQLALLERQDKTTKVLTPHEFVYQANWVKSFVRRRSQAWFVQLKVASLNQRIQPNVQEYLEMIVLSSIRDKYDLVTATKNRIFFILNETDEEGVKIVLNRIEAKTREKFNFVHLPYEATYKPLRGEDDLSFIEEQPV